jgi:hypothetical protein
MFQQCGVALSTHLKLLEQIGYPPPPTTTHTAWAKMNVGGNSNNREVTWNIQRDPSSFCYTCSVCATRLCGKCPTNTEIPL